MNVISEYEQKLRKTVRNKISGLSITLENIDYILTNQNTTILELKAILVELLKIKEQIEEQIKEILEEV